MQSQLLFDIQMKTALGTPKLWDAISLTCFSFNSAGLHLSKETQRYFLTRVLLWRFSHLQLQQVLQALVLHLQWRWVQWSNANWRTCLHPWREWPGAPPCPPYIFLREECVWGSTWETAHVTIMQTRILAGIQCPGLWWKKYPLLSRKIRNITVLRHVRLFTDLSVLLQRTIWQKKKQILLAYSIR